MAIIPKFYINSVIAIGVRNNKKVTWIGTGFLALRFVNENGDARPFLVTNKHVIEEENSIVIRLKKEEDENFETIDIELFNNGEAIYLVHPNEKIDIAVIPLIGSYFKENKLSRLMFDIDNNAMTSQELREAGVDEGSLIHMLGFPMGLVNANSTIPICRLGCVARNSKTQVDESFNILVDIQNFPGNSGSPIITRPEIVAIEGTEALNKSVLLGIVHSYFPYQEELLNTQTKKIVEIRSENSGIALVHPVEYIREVIDLIQPPYISKTKEKNE